jgi:hypothetical protein
MKMKWVVIVTSIVSLRDHQLSIISGIQGFCNVLCDKCFDSRGGSHGRFRAEPYENFTGVPRTKKNGVNSGRETSAKIACNTVR